MYIGIYIHGDDDNDDIILRHCFYGRKKPFEGSVPPPPSPCCPCGEFTFFCMRNFFSPYIKTKGSKGRTFYKTRVLEMQKKKKKNA